MEAPGPTDSAGFDRRPLPRAAGVLLCSCFRLVGSFGCERGRRSVDDTEGLGADRRGLVCGWSRRGLGLVSACWIVAHPTVRSLVAARRAGCRRCVKLHDRRERGAIRSNAVLAASGVADWEREVQSELRSGAWLELVLDPVRSCGMPPLRAGWALPSARRHHDEEHVPAGTSALSRRSACADIARSVVV